MEIPERYESFNKQKVENIVKGLIESGAIFSAGISLFVYIFLDLRSLRSTNAEIYEFINETNDNSFRII